jgi:hypothetical protein
VVEPGDVMTVVAETIAVDGCRMREAAGAVTRVVDARSRLKLVIGLAREVVEAAVAAGAAAAEAATEAAKAAGVVDVAALAWVRVLATRHLAEATRVTDDGG